MRAAPAKAATIKTQYMVERVHYTQETLYAAQELFSFFKPLFSSKLISRQLHLLWLQILFLTFNKQPAVKPAR
jgi:hypothetical protein